MRLNKFLQEAGVGSRRKAEALVAEGRVSVNGVVAGPTVEIKDGDKVAVDGAELKPKAAPLPRLFIYHKPIDVLVTASDPQGRTTIYDVMPKGLPQVVPVGRLDVNSEGLLLLTTDGRLAQYLMHPSSGFERIYRVRVFGALSELAVERIRKGVKVNGVQYQGARIALEKETAGGKNRWYRVSLNEGKNREVRKIFLHFRCTVNRLIRVSYGPYKLGTLPKGVAMEVPASSVRNLMRKMEAADAKTPGART